MNLFPRQDQWVGRLPFLPIAVAFALGILLRAALPLSPGVVCLAAAAGIIGFLIYAHHRPQSPLRFYWLLWLFLLSGWARFDLWEQQHLRPPLADHLPLHADSIRVEIKEIEQRSRVSARATLRTLYGDNTALPTEAVIKISFPKDWKKPLLPGQQLTIRTVDLLPLPMQRNPGQFDYGGYLRWRGVTATCYVTDPGQIHLLPSQAAGKTPGQFLALLRNRLTRQFDHYFAPEAAGFLKALLLGRREGLDREVLQNFQNAGVMHVLAISGLHVGFVAVIGYLLLSFLPIYFKKRNVLLIILLTLYMLLTGAQPPVARATLMAALFLLALNFERKVEVYNILFAAMFIILLAAPQQLFWVGFQFSFIAVLSILYFYQKLEPAGERLPGFLKNPDTRQRLRKFILIPFLVSFSAQVGTAPLTMYYFYKISFIALLINIVIIPYIGVLVGGGFLFLALSFWSDSLALAVADFLTMLINLLTRFVSWSAHLPGAYLEILNVDLPRVILYFLLILLVFNLHHIILRKWLTIASLVLTVFLLTSAALTPPLFNLIVLDVGQGDAALLSTPEQQTVLIDAGPSDDQWNSTRSAILPALYRLGYRHLNKVFLTHPHNDHIGGFFELAGAVRIDSVYLPLVPGEYFWQDSLLKTLEAHRIPYRLAAGGDRVVIDKQTRAYLFGPSPGPVENEEHWSGSEINNRSLILQIRHIDQSMLFTGDAESEAESYSRRWGKLLESQFLKVGHHGSSSSTSEDFLRLISPRLATISVGEHNHFGHPASKVLNLLEAYRVETHRTDREGAVWLQIFRNRWRRYDWRNRSYHYLDDANHELKN